MATSFLIFLVRDCIPHTRKYGVSEAIGNKKYQKKAFDYRMKKLTPIVKDSFGKAADQLSTKVRPKKRYKTLLQETQLIQNKSLVLV